MRLLNASNYEFEEFQENVPQYAILSHRWGNGEVTYQDMLKPNPEAHKGWSKVENCCRVALSRGLAYVWIDTCCIDKSSSAELTESINSMYSWYESAVECYAYLADVTEASIKNRMPIISEEMAKSDWFKRGWTLQELIAPSVLIFFNQYWVRIQTRNEFSGLIRQITGISQTLLEGKASLSDFSLAQKMAWAAPRRTTRPEDEAYSLLGIFEVNMPLLYGEGTRAFRRLQEEIIKQYDDQTLFAWHNDKEIKPVLAPSAACFGGLHDLICIHPTNDDRFGHTVTNSGLND